MIQHLGFSTIWLKIQIPKMDHSINCALAGAQENQGAFINYIVNNWVKNSYSK